MKINFITSNKGKIATLQSYLKQAGCENIIIAATNLNIVEPQEDSVAEVSLSKAQQAFAILKEPVLVEDGGIEIEALNGFPGAYAKYAIQTLGADGILRLMHGITNRAAKFVSTATFIDISGDIKQFHRKGGDVLIANHVSTAHSPWIWSDLWKIAYVESAGKIMAEMSEEEVNQFYTQNTAEGALNIFANWLKEHSTI